MKKISPPNILVVPGLTLTCTSNSVINLKLQQVCELAKNAAIVVIQNLLPSTLSLSCLENGIGNKFLRPICSL